MQLGASVCEVRFVNVGQDAKGDGPCRSGSHMLSTSTSGRLKCGGDGRWQWREWKQSVVGARGYPARRWVTPITSESTNVVCVTERMQRRARVVVGKREAGQVPAQHKITTLDVRVGLGSAHHLAIAAQGKCVCVCVWKFHLRSSEQ